MAQKWVEKELALLDQHELTDEDGNVTFSLSDSDLETIAGNNNKRIRETGDEVPICIGHTRDGVSEKSQPEIVGWGRSFKVKKLFNTGRKAIFCTAKFMADKVDEIQKYPRRSVELWLKKMLIDPIALLGATTPERDLGLIRFSADGQRLITLSPSEGTMNTDEIVAKVLEALKQSDVWKWCESQMQESAAPPEGEGQDGAGLPEPTDMAGESGQDGAGSPPPEEPPVEDDNKKYAAGAAGAPTGTSTYVPGSQENQVKMERDKYAGQVHKYAAAYTQAYEMVQDLQTRLNRAEREKDLVKLDAEGVVFDMDEELKEVESMEPERYEAHLNKMRQRYVRAPIGGDNLYRMSMNAKKPGISKSQQSSEADADSIVDYALANGMSYGEAKSKLQGSKEQVF